MSSRARSQVARQDDRSDDAAHQPGRSQKALAAQGEAAIRRILSPREDSIPHSADEMARMGKIQRDAALELGQSVGLPDFPSMMQAQAKTIAAQNTAAGTTQEERVAKQSQYQSAEVTLSPQALEEWNHRAGPAIANVVAYANQHFPDLKLTTKMFVPAFIECLRDGAIAGANGDGTLRFGVQFVVLAEKHPEQLIATIVHELHGHPEYDGVPADERFEERNLGAYLYLGTRRMMGAQATSRTMSGAEYGNYMYQESEIFAKLRGLPYEAVATDETAIESQLTQIRQQWEPRVAAALVHGLYRRLLATPELTPQAIKLYAKAVAKVWHGDPLLERILR